MILTPQNDSLCYQSDGLSFSLICVVLRKRLQLEVRERNRLLVVFQQVKQHRLQNKNHPFQVLYSYASLYIFTVNVIPCKWGVTTSGIYRAQLQILLHKHKYRIRLVLLIWICYCFSKTGHVRLSHCRVETLNVCKRDQTWSIKALPRSVWKQVY